MKRQLLGCSVSAIMLTTLFAGSVDAQRSGQSAKISIGTVVGTERVDLRSTAGRSAVVGGVVGYHATSSSKSSSRKWRNAAIGSAAMTAAELPVTID